jgi:hypothetical protein
MEKHDIMSIGSTMRSEYEYKLTIKDDIINRLNEELKFYRKNN